MARDAGDVARVFRLLPRLEGSADLPRRWDQPQRPVADRRDPRRRSPALDRGGGARRRRRGARVKPGMVLGHANRVLWPYDASSGLTRRAPTSPASEVCSPTTRAECGAGIVADSYSTRPLADLRAALGDRDRHSGPGRGRSGSPRPSRSWRRAWPGSATRSRADAELSERIRKKLPDQEHHRLPALRLPGRRRAGRRSSAAAF